MRREMEMDESLDNKEAASCTTRSAGTAGGGLLSKGKQTKQLLHETITDITHYEIVQETSSGGE